MARKHAGNAVIGKNLSCFLTAALHIAFADYCIKRAWRNHRMMSHGDNELVVFARILKLLQNPFFTFFAVARTGGIRIAVFIIVQSKEPVTRSKLHNIAKRRLIGSYGLVGAEFIIHIPQIMNIFNRGNGYDFIAVIALCLAALFKIVGGGDNINPFAALFQIAQHLDKFLVGFDFAVFSGVARKNNNIRGIILAKHIEAFFNYKIRILNNLLAF